MAKITELHKTRFNEAMKYDYQVTYQTETKHRNILQSNLER